MLSYLLYTSKQSESLDDSCLKDIMVASERYNKLHDITGILIKYDHTFIQYLEGEKGAISELYSVILSDSRHHSVELQFEGCLEHRLFPDWGMALQVVDEELFNTVKSYQTLKEGNGFIQSLDDDGRNLGLKMLRYFFDLKHNFERVRAKFRVLTSKSCD